MNRLLRSLLGISLVVSAVPAAAVAFPETFEEVWTQITTSSSETASDVTQSALTRITSEVVRGERGIEDDHKTPDAPAEAMAADELLTRHAPTAETTVAPSTQESKTPSTSNTVTETSAPPQTASSTTGSPSPAPTEGTTTTLGDDAGSRPEKSPETISGDACPCTVKGTATLKGKVGLQGDLVIDGGVLIARPGVDLDGNGHQIMFINGGRADFQGTKVFTWSNRGSEVNLKRDINFRNLQRMIWVGGGPSVLKYFTVSDSGTPALGDYPLHWHLNRDRTRGTVVEGVVVINGRNHAFVPHGSNGITFKDVIAKNIRKSAFWWDAPGTNNCNTKDRFCTTDNSNDITYDHALVDGVYELQGHVEYHRVAGFVLNAGSGNVIRDSVVLNIEGGADCSGFHWSGAANMNVGGNVWVAQNLHARDDDCHGIFVWQNDGNRHVVNGFTGSGIGHGAYVNDYEYVNFDVPYVEIHAAGWEMRNGRIGTVTAHRHKNDKDPTVTFTDVFIDRFIVDNGSGDIRGVYILDNTGLRCNDVEYRAVVPGTRVVIDGTEC